MSNPKQLKCPSCGATLNLAFPNQLIIECPYCHQQVVNDTYSGKEKENEPRVLEFGMTENEVLNQIVSLLIENKNVPTDIFDKMKIASIEKYYVPMYIFEGTFRAPWTAEKERQEKRQRIGRDGKVENYYETLYDYFNGEDAGNFSVNCIPSNEVAHLNLNLGLEQNIVVNPSKLSPFSKVQINSNDSIKIITPSCESDSVWWENGEPRAQNIGVDTACSQAPGHVTSCSASCELKKTSFVYIPLWKIQYEYNKEMYSFIFYAEQYMDYNSPTGVSIEALPTVEQEGILDKYTKRDSILSKIRDFGCLGVTLIGFIGCWAIDNYHSKHYLDSNYHGHSGDEFDFLWKMFLLGIALIVLMTIIKYLWRRKDGIDDIEEDIANRTQMLNNEANNYRRKTGKLFFEKYTGEQYHSDNPYAFSFANPTSSYEANPPKTKTCVRCSKQIDVHHMYCRYCGAKQN